MRRWRPRLRRWQLFALMAFLTGGGGLLLHHSLPHRAEFKGNGRPGLTPPVGTFALHKGEDGDTDFAMQTQAGRFRLRQGGVMPADMPYGFVLYPQAHLTENMKLDDPGAAQGHVVQFTSTDPPDRLAAFYREQVREAKLSIVTDRKAGSASILAGRYPDGRDGGFQLTIDARNGGGAEATLVTGFGLDVAAPSRRDPALDELDLPVMPMPTEGSRSGP